MMGEKKKSLDRGERAYWSELRRIGEYVHAQLCDCVWDWTPSSLALWWLRKRVARLKDDERALRHAVKIHRSAEDRRPAGDERLMAQWEAIEAEFAAVDKRLADLERRTLEWSAEQRMRTVLIGLLVLGLATSYLGWLADVLAAQAAYSLAVAIAP